MAYKLKGASIHQGLKLHSENITRKKNEENFSNFRYLMAEKKACVVFIHSNSAVW